MKNLINNSRAMGKNQRGFSSVELGLTLLVVAILVVGAIAFFTKNLRQASITNNIQQIQSIAGAAKSTYGYNNQYGQVTTAVAVRGHLIPDSLRDGTAATATNNFGAAITVDPANGSGTNDMVKLVWGNVPSNQCSDIVTGISGSARQIQVGTTDVQALDGTLNIDTLTTQCETGNVVSLNIFIGRS